MTALAVILIIWLTGQVLGSLMLISNATRGEDVVVGTGRLLVNVGFIVAISIVML